MPRCYKCKTEQPVLNSRTTVMPDHMNRPASGSYALCDKCTKEVDQKAK